MSDTLLEFPCDFPLKVMGKDTEAFLDAATDIVSRYAGAEAAATRTSRSSREGRFVALNFVVYVTSKQQVDALYQALSDNEHVMVVL